MMEKLYDVGGIYEFSSSKAEADYSTWLLVFRSYSTKSSVSNESWISNDTCIVLTPQEMNKFNSAIDLTCEKEGFFSFKHDGEIRIIHAKSGLLRHADDCFGKKVSQLDVNGELFNKVKEYLTNNENRQDYKKKLSGAEKNTAKKKRKNISENNEYVKADKREIFDYIYGLFSYMRGNDLNRYVQHKFPYLSGEEVAKLMEEWWCELQTKINFTEEACISDKEFYQRAHADQLYWLMRDKQVQKEFAKETNLNIDSLLKEKDLGILFEESTGNDKNILASFIVWVTENYWETTYGNENIDLYVRAKNYKG